MALYKEKDPEIKTSFKEKMFMASDNIGDKIADGIIYRFYNTYNYLTSLSDTLKHIRQSNGSIHGILSGLIYDYAKSPLLAPHIFAEIMTKIADEKDKEDIANFSLSLLDKAFPLGMVYGVIIMGSLATFETYRQTFQKIGDFAFSKDIYNKGIEMLQNDPNIDPETKKKMIDLQKEMEELKNNNNDIAKDNVESMKGQSSKQNKSERKKFTDDIKRITSPVVQR